MGTRRYLHELPSRLLSALLCPVPSEAGRAATADEATLSAIDWQALGSDAERHALGVLFYQRLQERGLSAPLSEAVLRSSRADAEHARLQCALQRADALEISGRLTALGIRHVFYKGAALREALYRPSWVRLSGDTDLLVARADVERTRAAVKACGFFQGANTDDYRDFHPASRQAIAATEARHYELAQFVKIHRLVNAPEWLWDPDFRWKSPFGFEMKSFGVVFNSAIDVHWALHFAFADEVGPLEEPRWIDVGAGGRLPVLGFEWSMLITIFKLYVETFGRLRRGFQQVVDLVALLRTRPSAAQWERVAGVVRRCGLSAAAFYTLSAAEDLAAERLVPPALLEEWGQLKGKDATLSPGTNMDYGDFVPYLIGRRIRVRLPLIADHQYGAAP